MKTPEGKIYRKNPSKYLAEYLEAQGVKLPEGFIKEEYGEECVIDFDGTPIDEINDSDNSEGSSNSINIPKNELIFE